MTHQKMKWETEEKLALMAIGVAVGLVIVAVIGLIWKIMGLVS